MSQRLAMLEAMIAKGATDPFVHYAHAMELRSLGRHDDALAAFAAVRQRFPAYVATYLMAGQLASEQGLRELARDFLGEGIVQARTAQDLHALSELETALGSLGPDSA